MTIDEVAALVSVLGAATGLGTLWEGLRKRRRNVILGGREIADRALELLDGYEARCVDLERKLLAQTQVIDDLTSRLRVAERRAADAADAASELEDRLRRANDRAAHLSQELANANTELDILRHHVKDLGLQFPERRDEDRSP